VYVIKLRNLLLDKSPTDHIFDFDYEFNNKKYEEKVRKISHQFQNNLQPLFFSPSLCIDDDEKHSTIKLMAKKRIE